MDIPRRNTLDFVRARYELQDQAKGKLAKTAEKLDGWIQGHPNYRRRGRCTRHHPRLRRPVGSRFNCCRLSRAKRHKKVFDGKRVRGSKPLRYMLG